MIEEAYEGTDGESGPTAHQVDHASTFGFPGAQVTITHRRPKNLQPDGSLHPEAWLPKGETPDGLPHIDQDGNKHPGTMKAVLAPHGETADGQPHTDDLGRPHPDTVHEDGTLKPEFWKPVLVHNSNYWEQNPEHWDILHESTHHNVVTNAGRDYLHLQGYGTSGLGTNGLNYQGLSNDTVTETSSSTTLSNEITTNGLGRAQGTVAHTAGTNTTTIAHTFTATGAQSAQKCALFTLSSAGTMCHVLSFTQRALVAADTLTITDTITLG